MPQATRAIPAVSRRLGRSPKAKRAVSQLNSSSICPTAFTCAASRQREGREPPERGQHPRQPRPAPPPATPGKPRRSAPARAGEPQRDINAVCTTVTQASVKAGRSRKPSVSASDSDAAR